MPSDMEFNLQANLFRWSWGEKPKSASAGTQGALGMVAAYGPAKAWHGLELMVDNDARQVFDSLVQITVGKGNKVLF